MARMKDMTGEVESKLKELCSIMFLTCACDGLDCHGCVLYSTENIVTAIKEKK